MQLSIENIEDIIEEVKTLCGPCCRKDADTIVDDTLYSERIPGVIKHGDDNDDVFIIL